MNCQELASRIEELQPDAPPRDVTRLCLLLANSVEDVGDFEDAGQFRETWQEMNLKLQAATDQHAAMTQELEDLAQGDP